MKYIKDQKVLTPYGKGIIVLTKDKITHLGNKDYDYLIRIGQCNSAYYNDKELEGGEKDCRYFYHNELKSNNLYEIY